jgi:hypothetical protein
MSDAKTETPAAEATDKSDWNVPKPDVVPRATYAPAALAFGITFFFWGLVTSPVVLLVGLVIMAVSLRDWVREMVR